MSSGRDSMEGYFDELLSEKSVSQEAPPVHSENPVQSKKQQANIDPPSRRTHPKTVRNRVEIDQNSVLRKPQDPKTTSAPIPEASQSTLTYAEHDPDKAKLQRLLDVSRPSASTLPPVKRTETPPETAPVSNKKSPIADLQTQALTPQAPKKSEEHTPEKLAGAKPCFSGNGRPAWAQQRFDVLLMEVRGLTLAVPLISLGQIYPLDRKLTPLIGQHPWYMGLMPSSQGKISVVNTALFVMPERYQGTEEEAYRFVVSLHGTTWGLAVDKVQQPSSLEVDQVNWRANRAKRPWLAGTVKSAMCALLDITCMSEMLESFRTG